MESKRLIGVLTACMVLFGAAGAFAQDWPQWRGPDRDGKVVGFATPDAFPTELTKAWSVAVGTGCGTPALVGDKLYVFARQGGDEVISCLNASDGSEVWQDKYAAVEVTGAPARHPGPRSSPAVAEGKVVTLGVGGIVSCLDAATGEVTWRNDPYPGVVPRFFTSMSPMILDGMAVVQVGGQGNGALMAYDLATGDVKWQWTGEAPEYASPVVLTVGGTKQVVTLTEQSVVGVNAADGALLWQIPFPPARRAYNSATPIVDGETVIYTGAARGTHAVKVEKQGDGFVATEVWGNPDVATQFNTPVLKDGLLFGVSDGGNLFCLNAQTGETAWIDASQIDQGGFAAIVDVGAVLLALPSNAEMIGYDPSGTAYGELGRLKVAETPTYAHPVIAGNAVYIKDQDTLTKLTF